MTFSSAAPPPSEVSNNPKMADNVVGDSPGFYGGQRQGGSRFGSGGGNPRNWNNDSAEDALSWRGAAPGAGAPRSFGGDRPMGGNSASGFSSRGGRGGNRGGGGGMQGRRPMSAVFNVPPQGGMRSGPTGAASQYRPHSRRWDESGGTPGQQQGDGTWANRDGRRNYPEREEHVFQSTKDKTTGINFDSYDNIEVEVSGRETQGIEPMSSFRSAADMPQELTANILRVRYDKPTPVQKYAIPILLSDRDLMACAQTGSGKTAAFLFPIIIKMLKQGPPPGVHTTGRPIVSNTPVVVYGGANILDQLQDLGKGCDICIATPGRLNDILERSKISLGQITYLVLDEADRMLDMGFAPQIHQIVSTKDMPTSEKGRQTAMFSATFPREIQQLARDFLLDYVYLTVGRVGSTNEFISQKLVYAEECEKPKRLLQLLREAKGRVLVFVETKKKADVIEDFLIQQQLNATSIHGDRTQNERTRALDLFKKGECPILVATDVAARGLDIHSITWVINLDLPHNIEDYVHRIGRTGRAGNAGLATSFVNEANRPILRELLRLLEEANQEIPSWFVDLTRACSSATLRFGSNRYGGGGRRGGGGNAFGGVDIRSFDDQDRRTFNAALGSPRGGTTGGYRSGGGGGRAGGGGGYPSMAATRYNNPPRHPTADEDDCW